MNNPIWPPRTSFISTLSFGVPRYFAASNTCSLVVISSASPATKYTEQVTKLIPAKARFHSRLKLLDHRQVETCNPVASTVALGQTLLSTHSGIRAMS